VDRLRAAHRPVVRILLAHLVSACSSRALPQPHSAHNVVLYGHPLFKNQAPMELVMHMQSCSTVF
jgi:hypothetical protein